MVSNRPFAKTPFTIYVLYIYYILGLQKETDVLTLSPSLRCPWQPVHMTSHWVGEKPQLTLWTRISMKQPMIKVSLSHHSNISILPLSVPKRNFDNSDGNNRMIILEFSLATVSALRSTTVTGFRRMTLNWKTRNPNCRPRIYQTGSS